MSARHSGSSTPGSSLVVTDYDLARAERTVAASPKVCVYASLGSTSSFHTSATRRLMVSWSLSSIVYHV
jgi:hypothetical protein